MSKLIIEIETLFAGQPRPYADSIYKYKVSADFYWDSMSGPKLSDVYQLREQEALDIVRVSRSQPRWVAKEERDWHEAYLDSAVEVSPGEWEITIIQPYLD